MRNLVARKHNQWKLAAMMGLATHGKNGGEFDTKLWANGDTMVTPKTEWATALNAVPRPIAVEIFKNGWVIPSHLIPKKDLY